MANSSSAQQLNIEAGQNIAVKMIAGQNLILTSDTEVQGMKLTSGGELVLTLSDGAMLTITNFAEIAKAGNTSLQLPNGQSVGMAQLAEALNPQGAIGATNLEYGTPDAKLAAGKGDAHLVKTPGKDEDIVVKLQPGDEYKFSFTLTEPASVKESGGQLVIAFKNGGEIIIPNYGAFKDAGTLPDFTLADGTTLGVGEFGEVLASAAQVSEIEPAAGDAGGGGGGGAGGGFGFGSTFSSGPLDGLGTIGPIDPTQLEYRADFRELDPASDPDYNPVLGTLPAAVVDETDLTGPVTVDGTITANFGGDGPGTFGATQTGTPAGNFNSDGSKAGGALTSEGQPVVVQLVGNTYTGTAHGDVIFTLTINSDGTYHFELTGTLDHADTTNPDDAINLHFGVTATDNDGDTDDGFITITVKDDGPVANDDFNSFNGEDLTTYGNVVTGVNGGPGAADDFSQDAGNHVSSVTVNGVTTAIAPGATVIVTGNYGLLTISSSGEYTYTLNPGVHGDTTENFTYTLTDGDGDSDPAILRIDSDGVPTIINPNDPAVITNDRVVDESDLGTAAATATGTVTANFYTDAPGTISFGGTGQSFTASTALTSEGQPVSVTLVGNQYVGTSHGETIFTLTLNPATGQYTFELTGTLDHPLGGANHDDGIDLTFGVTATDSDGDTATSALTITVKDDGPVANNDVNSFNAEDITTTGNVVTGLNGGPGAADVLSEDAGNTVTSVTVGGVTTNIPAGGTVVVNGTYGVLAISSDGTYQYSLLPTATGDTVDNFTYTLTDGDGDTSAAILSIDADGVPVIYDPNDPNVSPGTRLVDESKLGPVSVTGDLNANFFQDGPGKITFDGPGASFTSGGSHGGALTSEGHPVDVTLTGNTYTGTSHGQTIFTLTLNPDTGAYEFTLFGTLDHADPLNPDDVILLNFGVTATDKDGDTDTSILTIRVVDDAPVANDDFNSFDIEDLTTTGNVVTGLNGGPGAADSLSEDDGNSVTSVTFGATTVAVPAGGSATIAGANGVLIINSDGSYTYTLNAGVKGDVGDDFTYGLTDGDGDTDTAVLHLDADGKPEIYNPNDPNLSPGSRTVDETNLAPATSVTGDLNANFFSDTPGTITPTGAATFSFGGSAAGGALTSEGYPVTVTLVGNTYTGTANGAPVFTLSINPASGNYTFTLLGTLDHADVNNPDDVIQLNFGVTATDSDGDTDSATLTINVKDDGPVAHDDHNSYNTADGGTNGNVVTGLNGGPGAADNLSQDDGNTVTKVSFGTTTVDVPTTGTVSIQGDHGTLTISADGSYTYTLDAGAGGGSGGTVVDTPRTFTGNSFPTLPSEGSNIGPGGAGALGELPSNMAISPGTTVSGQVTFEGAGYTNSLGVFTVAADGTLQAATMIAPQINGPGANFNAVGGAGAASLGFFLVADGFTNNGAYAGLDFSTGTLNFVYDNGLGTERPATVNDPGAKVSLVFTDAGGAEHVIQGPIYFTSDRGGSNSLNPDGLVHTVSGVGSDPNTLTIAFEDLPNGGDFDYNDIVFNVQLTDHTTTGGGDVGDQFTYTLTDGDGDSSTAVLYLDGDGQPVIADPATRTIDESDLNGGTTSVSGHITADFFTDGPGTITPTGAATFTSSTTLTSGGQPVTVTVNGGVYTGTAGGQTVFTLTIQPNGDYKFDLKGTLDHPNTGNPDDAINLTFGITATDSDGDKDTSTLTIVVKDDGPVANDDTNSFNGEAGSTTGNVVTGLNGGAGAADKLSQDDTNTVTKVTFGGTTVNVPTTGTATINGTNGTLVIKADGSYTYTLKPGVHGDTADQFTYTLKDGDGDTDTAILKITSDGVPEICDPNVGPDSRTVDETNLNPETSVTGTVQANFFSDTPGTFQATGANTFSFGGSTAATLTSEGRPVTVTLSGDTYTGTAGGQTIFTLKLNADGSYKFDLKGTLDHADKSNPDDVIQLNFGVTARDSDGDTDSATLTINVKDDGPVAHNDVNSVNITTTTVPVDKDYNVVLVLDVSGSMAGDKLALLKSAVNNLLTSFNNYQGGDVKVHFVSFASQTGAESTFTVTNAGDFAAAQAFINALVANGNTNYEDPLQSAVSWLQSGGPGGPIAGGDTYTYFVSDGEPNTYVSGNNHNVSGSAGTVMNEIQGIGENATTDNDGTLNEVGALQTLSAQVIAVGIGVSSTTLGRLDVIDSNGDALDVRNPADLSAALQGSNPVTTVTVEVATGNVITGLNGGAGAADNLSEDDVNTVSAVKFGATTVNVPAGGFATINGDFGTLKIYSDGSYTYTAFDNADLSRGLNEVFTYTLKDGDGDTSNATLTLVSDGVPVINDPNTNGDGRTVDETNLNPSTSVTGTVTANFFADTPGTFQPTGASSFSSSTTLTSEGRPVSVSLTGNTYTGTANGVTIFTLTLNTDGSYKFDLKGTLDHPNTGNPDDTILLNFGVTARDSDGDIDTATLTINVKDDGPVANDDTNSFNGEAGSTTGNVVTGLNGGAGAADKLSQDDTNTVTKVTFGGTTVNVPTSGTATINGTNGTLVIKADGSYTYTLKPGVNGDTSDSFTYTLKDGDGDTDTAILKIKSDGTPEICDPNVGPDSRTVDETNLNPNTSVSGSVQANFFSDTPGTFLATGANTFSFGGSTAATLTSEGRPVTVTLSGDTYTGTAGGQTIFTLKLNADGTYKFDLKGTLDHADKSNPDDVIKLNFGVTARDSDGDTDSATLTINVKDDGPVANDDHNTVTAGTATGNVVTGLNGGPGAADQKSQDDVNVVTKVTFGGTTVNVPTTGTVSIAGDNGVLKIAADGSYTYTANGGTTTTSALVATLTGSGVTFEVYAAQTATGVEFTVKLVGGIADANGFFVDEKGDGGPIFTLGGGNNMNGASNGFDYAVALGTVGGNDPDVTEATFTIQGLSLSDIEGAVLGIRATSVGPDRDDSVKLTGTATVPAPQCPNDEFTYTLQDGDGDTSTAQLFLECGLPTVTQPQLTTCDLWVKEDKSVALNVQAKLVNPTAGEQLTVTISGIKDGWAVDTSTSGGFYNAATHTWSITLPVGVTTFNGGPTVSPPANSDADMAGLTVKATASNGFTSSTATGTENVYVDAVADAITVNASNTTGHDNTAIPLTITLGASADVDGSEKITKIVITGLPAGATLNHGVKQGDGSWVLSKTDLSGLTMNPGSFMGNLALTVKAYNVETTLSGLENDTSDNTYVATTGLNVNVFCDPNPPTLEVCDVWVKEDKSVALNVQASLNFPHPGEHLVITISGFKDGWTVNTTASGGTYNATTKTWSITLPPGVNFSGGPTVKPPANSDLDLTGLQVKAVATDGTYTATSTATENVFVDAVIDAPVLTVPATVNYLWVVNQSNPSALPITTKVTDTDGSETITKVVLDLNNTFTNPAGGFYTLEDIGVKLNKGTETAPGIWTINVNAGDAATALNGLALITPNSNYYWPLHNGSHSGTITVQSYAKETTLGGLENDTSDNQTVVTAYICYTFAVSPLVLDLGSNGFDLVGQDQGVLFDMTNDGLKDKTSWVGASDGLLALDLNHDGVINNQSELFGNNGTATDGFANLAQYDSNGDGKIDAGDAVFADLKVWQDANQDGVSDAGELQSLGGHGIASISLNTTAVNQMIGENGITDVASITFADGSQGQVGDVWFNVRDAADNIGVTFRGDASDDYVTGTYKNDFLGGGAGDNQLTGGEGGDTFFLDANGMAVITDFNLNAGDSLDLSDILTAFDPLTDSLHNFVHAVSDGADTLIQVDPTGTGSAFTTIAVLEGVQVDLNALTAHGNLIA